MREFLVTGSVVAACVALALATSGCRDPVPPPRAIVFISIDTLRADMLGAYGYREHPTSPFLDSLAAESVLFENSLVHEPHTASSHASLFTGQLPRNHSVTPERGLTDEIATLAQQLGAHGYRTQAFADGGYLRKRWGLHSGFEGYDEGSYMGFAYVLPLAQRWLQQHGEERFFLFLHSYDTHSEGFAPYYEAPGRWSGRFSSNIASPFAGLERNAFEALFRERGRDLTEADLDFIRARYAEGIRFADDKLADFFAAMKELGIYDDALIVIWSDHGEAFGEHGLFIHQDVYTHTLRVPLMVRLPGGARAGERVSTPVGSIDIAPTLLDLAGAPPLPGADGSSFAPLLRGDEGASETPLFGRLIRAGRRNFSLRQGDLHAVIDENLESAELYRPVQDPLEQRPLDLSTVEGGEALFQALRQEILRHDDAMENATTDTLAPIDDESARQLRALGYVE